MTPYYDEGGIVIYHGDCLTQPKIENLGGIEDPKQ